MDIFVPKFIKYQLYLLQLENYELGRYWKLLKIKGFFPDKHQPQRKELVWTAKAKALMVMAVALHLLFAIFPAAASFLVFGGTDGAQIFVIVCFIAGFWLYFLWYSIALILIRPLDGYAKNKLAKQARLKIERLKDLKIIGIAGSYGKTTVK